MLSRVAKYAVGEDIQVEFEIEPLDGYRPVSADKTLGQVHDALRPALAAARVVLEGVKSLEPDAVSVTFGIKVSGTANWVVAKAASEANFEIQLTWKQGAGSDDDRELDDEAE
jgi:hypothetical protein